MVNAYQSNADQDGGLGDSTDEAGGQVVPQAECLSIAPVILAGGSGTRLWPLSREH